MKFRYITSKWQVISALGNKPGVGNRKNQQSVFRKLTPSVRYRTLFFIFILKREDNCNCLSFRFFDSPDAAESYPFAVIASQE